MSRRQPVSRAPSLRSSEKEISFANIEDVVTDLLPTDFPSVLESDTVMTAVKNMKAAGRGSCLVVDEDKKFVGIFTERDFVNGVFENNNEDDASSASVKTVMTPKDSCMTGKYIFTSCIFVRTSTNSTYPCRCLKINQYQLSLTY